MRAASDDVRERLLEHVFPELRYGGDADIERYFDLRAQGRTLDALFIYKNRLVSRYPDQDKRILLLKLYRQHSPLFAPLLRELLLERADLIMQRLKAGIDRLVANILTVSMKDTYAVLKAMERTAHLLPDNPERARQAARQFQDFSRLLGYRTEAMDRLCYLLDEFYDQTSQEKTEATDFLALSQAYEAQLQRDREERSKKNFFDLSRITFQPEDIRRIEISSRLERNEDKALAYCFKYWLKIGDPAFERIIRLYSQKNGTSHYKIFMTIKLCRHRKYRDDEVLSIIASTVATEYSYTVQGDIYMQQAWKRLKASLYQESAGDTAPMAAGTQRTGAQTGARRRRQPALPKPVVGKLAPSRSPDDILPAGNDRSVPAPQFHHAKTKAAVEYPAAKRVSVERPRPPDQARSTVLTAIPAAPPKTNLPPRGASQPEDPEPRVQGSGPSVSDRIRRLSGSSYDVYREAFLDRVGNVIRELLQQTRGGHRMDHEQLNQTEFMVRDFLARNYTNSHLDWEGSVERQKLQALEADLPDIDVVISTCFSRLARRQ